MFPWTHNGAVRAARLPIGLANEAFAGFLPTKSAIHWIREIDHRMRDDRLQLMMFS